MKRWLPGFMVSLGLVLCMAWTGSASTRGIKVKARTSDGGEREIRLYSGCHALVIGCGEYRDSRLGRLKGAVRDAKEVAGALKKLGFKVKLVLNPDSEELSKAFYGPVEGPGEDPNNALFVFFAGHGHTVPCADGTRLGCIVPVDAPDPDNVKCEIEMRNGVGPR